MTKTNNFTASISVNHQVICDTICSGVEGGIAYWAESFLLVLPATHAEVPNPEGLIWYGREALYDMPFDILVVEQEEHKPGAGTEHHLTPETLQRGLMIMATKYGQHFSDLINDNGDAVTADVFIQCCVFGELIYG